MTQQERPRKLRPNYHAIAEFERVRTKLLLLVDWLGVELPRRHLTMFVDTADLRARCQSITKVIDSLVNTPRRNSKRELIRKRVLRLLTEVDNLDMYTKGLKGSLDYWHSRFYRAPRKSKRTGNQAPNHAFQRVHSRFTSRAGRAHRRRTAERERWADMESQ